MKIAVLVKRVPDTASVFKISGDGASVDLGGLKFVMSPYDEYAVEEAIRLKESAGAEVIAVSLGPAEAKDSIRSALAMGADAGLLVTGEGVDALTPKGVAMALAAAVKHCGGELCFAGKQAVDDDASQVPERVAELLEWPHASVVTRLTIEGDKIVVIREIEGGQYTLEFPVPALVTMDKGINTPRYPTLPNIMKAKKKPIEEVSLDALGLTPEALSPGIQIEGMSLPRQDRLGRVLKGEAGPAVQELMKALRDEEKVF